MSESTVETRDRADPPDGAGTIPGEPGLWVFLLGDMVIFAVMFVAFLTERADDAAAFAADRASVDLTIGLTNTMVLLVSSLLVVLALNAVRAGRFGSGSWYFAAGMGCAVLFTALKAVEYTHLISSGHGPDTGPYFMWLFILTGVHLFHVVLGIAVLAVLCLRARRRLSSEGPRRVFYEGGACYWHLVDLLWMVLFPLVYLVA
ncbi:cytochrome c oxidase subunit 3 [Gordonia sp. NPDC127522]|uniref:cytochrome c oxidase subunit 3 n=1 Tax=Gordonia sp. NPDC127522 TaxID=3345390 RepID=UPI0036367874